MIQTERCQGNKAELAVEREQATKIIVSKIDPATMQRKPGHINRAVAAILSIVWGGTGTAGLVLACVHGRWVIVFPAIFALWYAVLWARVFVGARLLTWNEIVKPWRSKKSTSK